MNTTEQELVPVVIDLGAKRKGNLDESALTALGAQLGDALRQIMVGAQPFMSIKGTPREIEALMTTFGLEKKHVETLLQHGPDSPQARFSLGNLNRSATDFERKTGLKWPFK